MFALPNISAMGVDRGNASRDAMLGKTALRSMVVVCCLAATACSTLPRSTRPTVDDFHDIASAIAQSLSTSPAVMDRSPQSERMVIALQKPTNLSSDVMTDSEQWAVVERIRSGAAMIELSQQRNIAFVTPAQRITQATQNPDAVSAIPGYAAERRPTHVLTGEIRSLTRAVSDRRTDVYAFEFELIDLAAGSPVWTDRFEYKRRAGGLLWD